MDTARWCCGDAANPNDDDTANVDDTADADDAVSRPTVWCASLRRADRKIDRLHRDGKFSDALTTGIGKARRLDGSEVANSEQNRSTAVRLQIRSAQDRGANWKC